MWLALANALAVEAVIGPEQPYTSIDAAIAAPDVTVIVIPAGTWQVSGVDLTRDLELRGAGTNLTQVQLTSGRLDIQGATPEAPRTIRLVDLTFTEPEPQNEQDEAFRVRTDSVLELERVRVLGASTLDVDGGLEGNGAGTTEPVFRVTGTLRATTTDFRGGASLYGPAMLDAASGAVIELTDCVVADSITASEARGWQGADPTLEAGAITLSGASLVATDTVFSGHTGQNAAAIVASAGSVLDLRGSTVAANLSVEGPAISVLDSTVLVSDSTFLANEGQIGSALSMTNGSLTMERSSFEHNVAFVQSPLFTTGTQVSILDSRFLRNQSVGSGGAFTLNASSGEVRLAEICHNRSGPDGGAARLESSAITFTNNLLWDNTGGGVSVGGGSATVQYTALVGNRNPTGAAVRGTSFLVIDSLLVGHDAEGNQTLVHAGNPGNADLSNNAYFDNTIGNQGGVSDLGSNVTDDPQLHVWPPRDCRLEDYQLRQGSPLIGAGSNAGTDIGVFTGPDNPLPGGDEDGDEVAEAYDCDDTDADLMGPVTVYPNDQDEDGFAAASDPGEPFESCPVAGRALRVGDCDDQNAQIFPRATEDIGGVDLDCDLWIDPAVRPSRACQTTGGVATWVLLGLGLLVTRRRTSA